jgi:hypothetical protein
MLMNEKVNQHVFNNIKHNIEPKLFGLGSQYGYL